MNRLNLELFLFALVLLHLLVLVPVTAHTCPDLTFLAIDKVIESELLLEWQLINCNLSLVGILVGDVGDIGRELGVLNQFERHNPAKSCTDAPDLHRVCVTIDVEREPSHVEVVAASLVLLFTLLWLS